MRRSGWEVLELGGTTRFQTSFTRHGEPDRFLTTVVDHPPQGFVFDHAYVYVIRNLPSPTLPDTWEGAGSTLLDPKSITVDPVTGAVAIEAPDGGWEIPHDGVYEDGSKRYFQVYVYYRVPETIRPGSSLPSGLTYDVAGIEGRQGAEQLEGAVTKIPGLLEVFGS